MIPNSIVLKNGRIYTMDKDNTMVDTIVVEKGKIVFTGEFSAAESLIKDDMDVIDLDGRTVLPGLIEAHVHSPGNAYNVLFNIDLFDAKTMGETLDTIKDFIEKHPEKEAYYGRGFMSSVFPGVEAGIGPRKERLDEICSDKPVVLLDYGGHASWLNSKALEVFGITPESYVEGGIVEIDPETGELWGTLKDEAKALYPDPVYTLEEDTIAMDWFQKFMNKYGYTGVMSNRRSGCDDPLPIYSAMEALDNENKLTLRVVGANEIKVNFDEIEQLEQLGQYKQKYNDGMIRAKTAKYFLDGAVEAISAYLLEPYEEFIGKKNFLGECLWDQTRLEKAFIETLKRGFNIHIHAIGDAAVHAAVDALEVAQKTVPGDHRNTITHLQLVSEEDKKRMGELGIIACCNVHWHFKDPGIYFDGELLQLGEERAEHEYPLKSLKDQGVVITSSGDIPITPYPNPFFAIQFGATRNLVNAPFYKVDPISDLDDPKYLLNKDERLSVLDMVRAYTTNAAYANFMDEEIGSLEKGKCGDMVIIDQDIFNIPLLDIEKTKVLKTIVDGNIVYEC